jgi:hypothetical protein
MLREFFWLPACCGVYWRQQPRIWRKRRQKIKARATRVKFYSPLVLIDKTGEKIRYETDAGQLATMLPQLSRAVARFVGNPVFRISAPNDAELRSTAARDLENIIKLSDTINKITKRLSKTLVASR